MHGHGNGIVSRAEHAVEGLAGGIASEVTWSFHKIEALTGRMTPNAIKQAFTRVEHVVEDEVHDVGEFF